MVAMNNPVSRQPSGFTAAGFGIRYTTARYTSTSAAKPPATRRQSYGFSSVTAGLGTSARILHRIATSWHKRQPVSSLLTWKFPMKLQSHTITQGRDRAPARAMLKGIGFTDEDLKKPIIG